MSRISSLATQIRAVNPTDMEDYDDPNLGTGGSRKGSPFDIHGQFRNALAPRGGIAFDGTAAARGSVALTGQDIAADPFTFVVVFKVRAAVSINNLAVLSYDATGYNRGSAAGRYGVTLNVTSAGSLQLQVIDSGWVESVPILYSGFVSAYLGKIVIVAATRNALYVNGLQVATGTFTGSVDSSYFVVGRHAAGGYAMTGEVYSASLYNYALSATDILEIYELGGGPPQRFRWGTQTHQITGWSNLVGTPLAGGSTTGFTFANTQTDSRVRSNPYLSDGLWVGTVVRLGYDFNNASGTGANVALRNNSYGTASLDLQQQFFAVVGTGQTIDLVLTQRSTQMGLQVGNFDGTGNFAFANMRMRVLGAIVHLALDEGLGFQLFDQSTNKLHAVFYPVGGTHVLPKTVGRVRYTTNTNGNQQILGQQALPANVRIRSWVIDSAGTPTVKLGNATSGAQFLAAVALSAGLNDIALLTRFCPTNNLWVNSTTTDALMHTIDYEIVD